MLRSNYWLELAEYKAKRSLQALLNINLKRVVLCSDCSCNCSGGSDDDSGTTSSCGDADGPISCGTTTSCGCSSSTDDDSGSTSSCGDADTPVSCGISGSCY